MGYASSRREAANGIKTTSIKQKSQIARDQVRQTIELAKRRSDNPQKRMNVVGFKMQSVAQCRTQNRRHLANLQNTQQINARSNRNQR